jgi:hypothetical protein
MIKLKKFTSWRKIGDEVKKSKWDIIMGDEVIGRCMLLKVDTYYHSLNYFDLDNYESSTSEYAEEIYHVIERYSGRVSIDLKQEYCDFDFGFLIVDDVELIPKHRGKGIIGELIKSLDKKHELPMFLKPFPLQWEGEVNDTNKSEFEKDLLKVKTSYLNCGFKLSSNENFMYRI